MDVEQKPLDLEDWGTHYPFVIVWREWVREYRANFGTLPDPNAGILEQDDALMTDLDTVGALFSHYMRKHRSGKSDAPPVESFDPYA